MNCRICGKKSQERVCKRCNYFLKYGATEEIIKNMLSDTKTQKIWKENEKIAKDLADVYYDSTIENYKTLSKKDSKENFGYNAFIDGIKLGIDIVIPMLDVESQMMVKEKIRSMIKLRRKYGKNKPE